jgi:NitT/TauT family transport system permease protein
VGLTTGHALSGSSASRESRLAGIARRWFSGPTLYSLLGIAVAITIWALLSAYYFAPIVLPGPWDVLTKMWDLLQSGVVFSNFFASFFKTMLGWAAAVVVGVPMGLLMGRFSFARAFFHDLVYVLANVPLIVYGVLMLVLFGISSIGPAFVVFLMVLPGVAINVTAGVESAERGLLAMSRAFRRSNWQVITNVITPAVLPFLLAGGRVSFADSWKLEALTESFGGSNGVGYQVNKAFQVFSVVDALAWMMFFVIFVLLIEHVILARFERAIFAWRDPVGQKRS